jgi:hypothetical protein
MDDILLTVDGFETIPYVVTSPAGYIIMITYFHSIHTFTVYYVTYRLTLNVKNYAGNPLANATVKLTGPVTRITNTDESGVALFTKIIAGEYTVLAFEGSAAVNASLRIEEDSQLVLSTEIGKLEARCQELQRKYQELEVQQQSIEAEHEVLEANYLDLKSRYEVLRYTLFAYIAVSLAVILFLVRQTRLKRKLELSKNPSDLVKTHG